jgi:hypothetical protein
MHCPYQSLGVKITGMLNNLMVEKNAGGIHTSLEYAIKVKRSWDWPSETHFWLTAALGTLGFCTGGLQSFSGLGNQFNRLWSAFFK